MPVPTETIVLDSDLVERLVDATALLQRAVEDHGLDEIGLWLTRGPFGEPGDANVTLRSCCKERQAGPSDDGRWIVHFVTSCDPVFA